MVAILFVRSAGKVGGHVRFVAWSRVLIPLLSQRSFSSTRRVSSITEHDEYRKKKHCHVYPKQTLDNGRFEIECELGSGSDGIVWLGLQQKVAMKFAQTHVVDHEYEIFQHLCESDVVHPGRRSIEAPLHRFDVDYQYSCLTFQPIGEHLGEYIEDRPTQRLLGSEARSVIRQLTQCLAFLRSRGVSHGDFRLENILVYGVNPLEVRLIDFGNAFRNDRPPHELVTPLHMKPPEILAGLPVNEHVDLWQLGCTSFELITGRYLISPTGLVDNIDTLDVVRALLGPLPSQLKGVLSPAQLREMDHDWYNEGGLSGFFMRSYRQIYKEPGVGLDCFDVITIEEADQDLTDTDLDDAFEVFSSVLRYAPENRVSADELMKLRWLRESA